MGPIKAIKALRAWGKLKKEWTMLNKAKGEPVMAAAVVGAALTLATLFIDIPEDVRTARERLSTQVQDLLTSCRSCSSWGERSEYKLSQWIEFVDEPMVRYTSLPKLVRIKDSLKQYLNIHQGMDRDGIVPDQDESSE